MPTSPQTEQIASLTHAVSGLGQEIREQRRESQEVSKAVTKLEAQVDHARRDLHQISKVVRDGGSDSLTERVTRVEDKIDNLDSGVAEANQQLQEMRAEANKQLQEMQKEIQKVSEAKTLSRGQIISGVAIAVATLAMSLWGVLAQIFRGP